jgi:hypothetical protein
MHNGADAAQDDATAGKPRFRFERGRDGPHLRRGARLGCPDRVEGRLVGLRDASMGQQRGGDFRHDLDLNAFRNVKRNGHSAALDLIAVILAWTYEKTVRGDYRRYQMAESVCISETRESAANVIKKRLPEAVQGDAVCQHALALRRSRADCGYEVLDSDRAVESKG